MNACTVSNWRRCACAVRGALRLTLTTDKKRRRRKERLKNYVIKRPLLHLFCLASFSLNLPSKCAHVWAHLFPVSNLFLFRMYNVQQSKLAATGNWATVLSPHSRLKSHCLDRERGQRHANQNSPVSARPPQRTATRLVREISEKEAKRKGKVRG